MKKILITGKNGQVGWELERSLSVLGEIYAFDRAEFDLGKPDQMHDKIREIKPDIIVNAAAYTAVDKAESEPEVAMAINGTAPGILAEEAKRLNALLVHYSTDYVFDGTKRTPYTEDDEPNPINVYGKTKLAGERAIQAIDCEHLIFRTSWVYGTRGKNFLLTVLRLLKEKDELRIVDDQIGAPTWCRTIADATAQILGRESCASADKIRGLYHLTASGQTSWYGFAKAIVEGAGMPELAKKPLLAQPSIAYPTPAVRPQYSVLSTANLSTTARVSPPIWETTVKLSLEATRVG